MRRSKKKLIERVLVGCGTFTILPLILLGWIAMSMFSEPDVTDLSSYHPFRSSIARERYLEHYDARAERWPVASECMTVDTSHGQTFVRVSGPVDGAPLVLLPPAAGTSLFWIPNIEALSASHRVYAVDNIYDFGRSVYRRAIKSPDDLVTWLDELFSALRLENDINLVGLSYGGWLTSQYALRFPERLGRIVLLAPAATIFPLPAGWTWRGILATIPHPYFLRSMTSWLFEDLSAKEDDVSKALVEELITDAIIGLKSFELKMPVHPTVLTDEELSGIKVPALFLVGENEKLYSARKAVKRLNSVAPQIETAVIPDAGHDLTLVQTEMVNGLILEFLEKPPER